MVVEQLVVRLSRFATSRHIRSNVFASLETVPTQDRNVSRSALIVSDSLISRPYGDSVHSQIASGSVTADLSRASARITRMFEMNSEAWLSDRNTLVTPRSNRVAPAAKSPTYALPAVIDDAGTAGSPQNVERRSGPVCRSAAAAMSSAA